MLRFDEGEVGDTGPNVGVEPEGGPYGDVEAFVSTSLRGRDGRLEKHFGVSQGLPGTGLNTGAHPAQVDFLADFYRLNLDAGTCCLNDPQRGVHNLWSY